MKVITVACQKGGIGKTTGAATLGVELEAQGYGPVVILDLDPQESQSNFLSLREAETPQFAGTTSAQLPTVLKKLESIGTKVVIIDTPPIIAKEPRAAMQASDFVLVPMQAGALEELALGPTLALVQAYKVPFAFLVTRMKARTNICQNLLVKLSKHGPIAAVYAESVKYPEANYTGQVAGELANLPKKEAQALTAYVVERVGLKKSK